jgi:hypothetical protein
MAQKLPLQLELVVSRTIRSHLLQIKILKIQLNNLALIIQLKFNKYQTRQRSKLLLINQLHLLVKMSRSMKLL